ncbi:hypothetical protein C7H19_00130 [Aphanothece hegewaldii CCALA 016]|uniref:Uncharacterized protein n=1 Tax=Aphanothece hegewaldii CCALA 016 TaxID=2107694 RepID=A0A2T1M312_9CHRO|nr:prepilin-type N-terminal cleavage/methylation domain-containing protein [Aphanothece hegewaldii]PSF39234.1 hypothetical protein C7H19_00130 [Aphanothece hegewaldii CCALA 016]
MFYKKILTKKAKRALGFSLTEMLVVLAISSILVSTLLYVMVDLMSSSQSDQARNSTNEEMKQALNYMATEMREAVYVYTGKELEQTRTVDTSTLNPVKNFLPNFGTNTRPIVAFWKVEIVPYSGSTNTLPADCTSFTGGKVNECKTIRIEQRTYTLVVYLQSTDNSNNKWKGDSRIMRYQLRKYSNPTTLTVTTGYVDPQVNSTFQQWPYDIDSVSAQASLPTTDSTNLTTLVDFVASPTFVNSSTTTNDDFNCPITQENGQFIYQPSPYGPEPTGTSTVYKPTNARSFFACVRDSSITTVEGFNQDVLLFLIGNAKGKPSVDKDQMLGTLQVQSISRGVVRKTVPD